MRLFENCIPQKEGCLTIWAGCGREVGNQAGDNAATATASGLRSKPLQRAAASPSGRTVGVLAGKIVFFVTRRWNDA
jgi:hypothetical protein